MVKIANPQQFQNEINRIMGMCQGEANPSRGVLASELQALANHVAAGPRPKSLDKLEEGAKEIYKKLTSLVTQAANIDRDNIVPSDEIRKVFRLLTAAQKSLDSAIDAVEDL